MAYEYGLPLSEVVLSCTLLGLLRTAVKPFMPKGNKLAMGVSPTTLLTK